MQNQSTQDDIARDRSERDAASMQIYGITPEQMADPQAALRTCDLKHFWGIVSMLRYRDAVVHKEQLRRLDQMEEERPNVSREVAYARSQAEKDFGKRQFEPLWQKLCGLMPHDELHLEPSERLHRIGELMDLFQNLAEQELRNPTRPSGLSPLPLRERADVSASERGERGREINPSPYPLPQGEGKQLRLRHTKTFLWDPLRTVCTYLGISRNRLSQYTKELTGMAAHEVVDVLRAPEIKASMRAEIAQWLETHCGLPNADCGISAGADCKAGKMQTQCATAGLSSSAEGDSAFDTGGQATSGTPTNSIRNPQSEIPNAVSLWHQYKHSRIAPKFHRGQWASTLGFANYQRFYRACLLYYGLAPSQIEVALIEELLQERDELPSPLRGEGAAQSAADEGSPELQQAHPNATTPHPALAPLVSALSPEGRGVPHTVHYFTGSAAAVRPAAESEPQPEKEREKKRILENVSG